MTILTFSIIVLLGAFLAGLVGSLTGLGGGVVVIPLLTLVFHVDIRYAIGAALLASIANSSGAASAYVKEGITNIRLGMFLEIATTVGAVVGAVLAAYTPTNTIAILFGVILLFSAAMTIRKKNQEALTEGSKLAEILKLNNSYPTKDGEVAYKLKNVGGGFSIMTIAGVLSGLLGIGSGALKVLAMDSTMHIPFKVSTTTSNFMIGVTAAASAVVYLQRGYMNPGIAFPVVLGVLGGAFTGSKLLTRLDPTLLRYIFCAAIVFVAAEMMYNGINHQF
ncbi:sulfite exporter TauE/SafE family protein [Mucilaginibacter sp. RS28]|uniref:Probable membrane transporter protein n=1 Tax=Mucilaginibacter straminoryzae TaxID=2932774 RepID=A0A9X1X378_9SPHI|nr:sulfite exporter TauE/SafE family protein [Mucilaginibacter straminoryzae]MCJ8209215.1 sulfite exporter TauE/SafE family protein [Mucilaginibacter straminoryzae]